MPVGVYKHKPHTLATKAKMSKAHTGRAKPWLKGNTNAQKDSVSYTGIHKWIASKLEKPKECENCGSAARKIQWANLSGEYLREVADWAALCTQCHSLFDNSYKTKVLPQYVSSYVGKKYHKLTVVAYVGKGVWLFKCECGNEKAIRKSHVNAGKTKSCGCYRKSFRKGVITI